MIRCRLAPRNHVVPQARIDRELEAGKGSLATSDSTPNELVHLDDRLALRPKEAARTLGICERKLRELLPELPVIRLDGVVLIPTDSLREWCRERAVVEGRRSDRIAKKLLEDL